MAEFSSCLLIQRLIRLQVTLYQKILMSKSVRNLFSASAGFDALPAITMLRKLCNHPSLISEEDISSSEATAAPHASPNDDTASGVALICSERGTLKKCPLYGICLSALKMTLRSNVWFSKSHLTIWCQASNLPCVSQEKHETTCVLSSKRWM